ncbi:MULTISPECIES: CBS domain-containing protein [Streptomyces]|uniref:CBS domain-containing protein n=1 Tax=Streptomyces TaxID=1883 RepID=UPI000A72C40F|nr:MULTISPECIES: CBS domain-containing protein [Streptomyces]MDH6225074.1 signal-transduction protein with cAMP-binding, CBS, and nucleotidyltransferase domain [Streptomyces sp. MJP52]
MLVRDAMTKALLTVGPAHTLRQAAVLTSSRGVGAALVLDPEAARPGIPTERDILNSLGLGRNPDVERAHAHLTADVVVADPSWSIDDAVRAMAHGGFRHLVVLERGEPSGMVPVRDVLRCLSRWNAS